jgi:hypothetical protein
LYATPDPSLPEAIVVLQRQELPRETRRLVEEAAQLLGEGRDIEARALVEKAQALVSLGAPAQANGSPKPNGAKAAEETGFPALAARLMAPVTAALANALVEAQRYSAEQAHALSKGVEERVAQLSGDVSGLQQSDATLTSGLEALAGRVTAHDERLAAADRLDTGFTASLATLNERVDQQTAALRGLQERHARRAAVLNDVLGNIAKLRDHHESEGETHE